MQAKKLAELLKDANLSPKHLELIDQATRKPRLHEIPAPKLVKPAREIRIGVVGDTHINSNYENLDFLNALYSEFKAAGVDFVIQTGDVTDGEHMHAGHEYEIKQHGIDRVIDYVINEFPNVGLTTHFIGGNHDESYHKQAGADICKLIAAHRSDMHYLGLNRGELTVGSEKKPTIIQVLHPGGGSAKALSYAPQRIVSEIDPANKPHVLILGHYHKCDYLFDRNIHIYQAGTTQSQSAWMARMNLASHLAGWLLHLNLREDGTVDSITQQQLWEDKLCRK